MFVTRNLILTLLTGLLCMADVASAAEHGYDSDVDSLASMRSAKKIIERQGGYFVPPEAVRERFNTDVQVPRRLPFTERQLLDCGRCILFPTVSKISYRDVPTTIMEMSRAPEARVFFDRTWSPVRPWFKEEPWAHQPLRDDWLLVRLDLEDKGRAARSSDFAANEEPLRPNEAFWLLLLLPPDMFVGEYFYTGATTDGGESLVIFGRSRVKNMEITHTPRQSGNTDVGRLAKIVMTD